MKHKKLKNRVLKPRNFDAINPLMRKGGAHDKTTKAKRHNDKQCFKVKMQSGVLEKVVNRLFPQEHQIAIEAPTSRV